MIYQDLFSKGRRLWNRFGPQSYSPDIESYLLDDGINAVSLITVIYKASSI